jgi:hypothetical protein
MNYEISQAENLSNKRYSFHDSVKRRYPASYFGPDPKK